jgi:hypothetical protein
MLRTPEGAPAKGLMHPLASRRAVGGQTSRPSAASDERSNRGNDVVASVAHADLIVRWKVRRSQPALSEPFGCAFLELFNNGGNCPEPGRCSENQHGVDENFVLPREVHEGHRRRWRAFQPEPPLKLGHGGSDRRGDTGGRSRGFRQLIEHRGVGPGWRVPPTGGGVDNSKRGPCPGEQVSDRRPRS